MSKRNSEIMVQSIHRWTNEEADEQLIEHVRQSMELKLSKKRKQGYGGWQSLYQCNNNYLLDQLKKHIDKGDMIDVINFAGMIDARTNMYGDKA